MGVWQAPTVALTSQATLYRKCIQAAYNQLHLAGWGGVNCQEWHPLAEKEFNTGFQTHKVHKSINFSFSSWRNKAWYCANAAHMRTKPCFLFIISAYPCDKCVWRVCLVTVPTDKKLLRLPCAEQSVVGGQTQLNSTPSPSSDET